MQLKKFLLRVSWEPELYYLFKFWIWKKSLAFYLLVLAGPLLVSLLWFVSSSVYWLPSLGQTQGTTKQYNQRQETRRSTTCGVERESFSETIGGFELFGIHSKWTFCIYILLNSIPTLDTLTCLLHTCYGRTLRTKWVTEAALPRKI